MGPSSDELYIGLMSGTSLDGIDAVLVDFAKMPRLLAAHTIPLAPHLRTQLLDLCLPGDNEIDRLGPADRALGEACADAAIAVLKKAGVVPAAVKAIGSHGQTIRHRPAGRHGFTLQIGDPATIAHRTGIATIADFRRRDVATGGQGAPLVPAFHQAIFGTEVPRLIINIGGMANLTLLHPHHPLIGFDSGPGNVLLDSWVREQRDAAFDHDGQWASSGQIVPDLLMQLRQLPYFAEPYPKSTGRELFNVEWLKRTLTATGSAHRPENVQATLAELTAITIAQAVCSLPAAVDHALICGGGAYNRDLLQRLRAHLGTISVSSTASLGVEPEWVEAMAFAWLARQTLAGRPGNAPAVTGAERASILGAIHPAG